MEESFKNKLKSTLYSHWQSVIDGDVSIVYHPGMAGTLRTLLHSSTKSYRYPVVTQLLAKCVNLELDTRCIQASRRTRTQGNFDARSVCHDVVVPWELENNSPLSSSREPYINNPLRVPEFSSDHRNSQKNKPHWDLLVTLFEHVETHPSEVFDIFKQALLEIRHLQNALTIDYPIPLRLSLFSTIQCVRNFLVKKSGGERLQLVCYALMHGLKARWGLWDEVVTSKINASDTSERKAADVVCIKNGVKVLAIEVKDQDFTLELLESAIKNARINQVNELMAFVSWKNPAMQKHLEEKIQSEFANGMNIYVVAADDFLSMSLALIGEEGRKSFFIGVCQGLEVMNCSFQTKKEWAKLLAEI